MNVNIFSRFNCCKGHSKNQSPFCSTMFDLETLVQGELDHNGDLLGACIVLKPANSLHQMITSMPIVMSLENRAMGCE